MNITDLINAHEINKDLRINFVSAWEFNQDSNPKSRERFPLFQDVERLFSEALKPLSAKSLQYEFSIRTRFIEKSDGSFTARHLTPLMGSTARAEGGRSYVTFGQSADPMKGREACSVCLGIGAGSVVGESPFILELGKLHGELTGAFSAPQFAKLRDQSAFFVAAGMQRMEGMQGKQAAECAAIGSGIFQILFAGRILKGNDTTEGLHFPAVWNCPVKLSGLPSGMWCYPNHVERMAPLADHFGVDPNLPNEHRERPWRRPCPQCGGSGHP